MQKVQTHLITAGMILVSPPPLSVPTTKPVFEWQSISGLCRAAFPVGLFVKDYVTEICCTLAQWVHYKW